MKMLTTSARCPFVMIIVVIVMNFLFIQGREEQHNFRGMDIGSGSSGSSGELSSGGTFSRTFIDDYDSSRVLKKKKKKKKKMMKKKKKKKKKKKIKNSNCENELVDGDKVSVARFPTPRSCTALANNDACNEVLDDGSGRSVFEVCRSSCDRCEEMKNSNCENELVDGDKVSVARFQNPRSCTALANNDACNEVLDDGSGRSVFEICRSSCGKCVTPSPVAPPMVSPVSSPTISPTASPVSNDRNVENAVLVPQCDPNDPTSYLSTKNPLDTRDSTFCNQYLTYCDKKLSTTGRFTGGVYLPPDAFYNIVESLYEQCAKTCSDAVGGIEKFCSMPTDLPEVDVDESYCDLIGSSEWTEELIQFEDEVFEVINRRRNTPDGIQCYTTGRNRLWPQSSPMIQNKALKCAARIQAKNIVMATIEANDEYPGNLHTVCPSISWDGMRCDEYSEKMKLSGYPDYMTDGWGYTKENAAWRQLTPEAVVDDWLGSDAGHCDTIMTQESKVVNTEIGVGVFYLDGIYGHIIVTAQRSH